MDMKSLYLPISILAAFFLSSPAKAGENITRPALFEITTDVVNQDLLPFTATISGYGNSFINKGAGFEPRVYRNSYIASKDAQNKIFVDWKSLTNYDSKSEGFLNNADVHVYRIQNGKFKLVRKDMVSEDGSHASGWIPAIKGNKRIISPSNNNYKFRWDDWNKPNADYYFSVRAIGKKGHLSPYSNTFKIISPALPIKAKKTKNKLINFKLKRSIFSATKSLVTPKSLTGKINNNGILILSWQPVTSPDLAGYIVYRSDFPPEEHKGYFLQLHKNVKSNEEYIKK